MTASLPFHVPYVTNNEMRYLEEVVRSRSFGGNGHFTKRVQTLLEDRYDIPHVLLTHSCTGALELAALLLGIGPGDEVIVPSYTFVSTASAFLRTGATIVFCEVDTSTMNLDVEDVRKRVTKQTKAVVPVHYAGIGADMDGIGAIAAEHDLAVIEDAAQAVEARIGDRHLGTIGSLGAVSFHETKNLHSGLGGALYVNDPALFDRAENIWERGTDRSKMIRGQVDKYRWVDLGSSFYPSELQAAFLLAQLESIDDNTVERGVLYRRYMEQLAPLSNDETFTLPVIQSDRVLNHHALFMILPSEADADRLRLFLRAKEIHAHTHFVPLHSSPMGMSLGYTAADLPITEEYAYRVLRMPLHNDLSAVEVDRVCAAVAEHFGG